MRSQPEIRAQGRDLGVDLALIMTFKCLYPGRMQVIQDPQLKGGVGGDTGAWACSPQNEERTYPHLPLCARPISQSSHLPPSSPHWAGLHAAEEDVAAQRGLGPGPGAHSTQQGRMRDNRDWAAALTHIPAPHPLLRPPIRCGHRARSGLAVNMGMNEGREQRIHRPGPSHGPRPPPALPHPPAPLPRLMGSF